MFAEDSGWPAWRIMVTGARDWTDRDEVRSQLSACVQGHDYRVIVVHGASPGGGVDAMARQFALDNADFGVFEEPHPPRGSDPDRFRRRNQYMVNLGADLCLAFATRWVSGTGQTARMARRAGIETVDLGVDTREEASPN